MLIKLTSAEYKVIGIAVVVAAVSLGIGVKYFWRAFPEAAIEFRVNRDDSAPLAEKFLAARGARLEGYRHAAVFDYDDESKVYLERTQGLVRMNRLTRGPIHLWRWSHRWFKPQQKEEFRADVTPAGEVAGFEHEIPESAPGANLDVASARALAEKFLTQVMKRDLADLEFVETKTDKRPARTDHSFTWKQKSVELGDGSWRVTVEVTGDQAAAYSEFLKVPEQWSRDYRKLRSRNESAQFVAEVFFFLLTGAMLVILILRLRDRDVLGRMSVAFGGVAAALYFLGQLNTFSLAEFAYRTTDSYASFLARNLLFSFLGAMGVGAFIFFLVASSEPVYRENFPRLISLRRYLSWPGLRSRSFFMANVVGIALTFFFFAYQTVFYLAAEKLGAWAPADVPFTDLLNTRIPWVTVLFIGFFPAVSEEMQFRAFAIPFLRKLLRGWPAALVLSAFIWGFLHSAYPNQPFFIRGVEVGLGGIVTGLIMLRFGILATLIWHYSVDALYTAFLLLRSPNHYLMVSGGLAAGIMLVPLLVALVAYWRSGTFTEESLLTNASEGVSRPPHKEAVVEAEAPLAYRALSQRRLVLAGVLTLVFIALAMVPVQRFGEGISLHISRQDALRAADAFLRQRHIEPASYHRVAWVYENVQPLAIRYLLERKSIRETDRIYREAVRPALWEARYFRPLQKEEHLVSVDPASGQVSGYQHLLDDDAPGVSLAPDQAQALAAKALEQEGYRLADFDLQNSQAKKQKARQDYTLVWQAKPGDPRNVGDAHYWLEVDVAGDQVVGFRRLFKLPEEWERQRAALRLSNVILIGVGLVVVVGMVAGGLILLVMQVRRAQIPWTPAIKVGAAVTVLWALAELNGLSVAYRDYDTSISIAAFQMRTAVRLFILPLLLGLFSVLVVGLAVSLYPGAWRIFRASARRLWRRDAAVAIVLSLAVGAALSRLGALLATRFHAYTPVRIGLFPDLFDAASPGAGFFLDALVWTPVGASLVALAVYVVRLGWVRRAWWLWVGGALLLINLGPAEAHSVPEFLLGWVMGFVTLAVVAVVVALFFRDNALAYVGAAFCLPLALPFILLFSQPVAFFRWNGLLLAALAALTLGWMFLTGESTMDNPQLTADP
jgi:membrane protease YdiL (CAAX protease family)